MSDKKEHQSDVIEQKDAVELASDKLNQKDQEAVSAEGKNEKTEAEQEMKEELTKTPKVDNDIITSTPSENKTVVIKKGGTALGLLALLVALSIGGVGYYFGQQEIVKINQKVTALEQKMMNLSVSSPIVQDTSTSSLVMPTFEKERAQIQEILAVLKSNDEKINLLTEDLAEKNQIYQQLQSQINKVTNSANSQPSDWLLNEADFLLGSALRKLLLDNDVDTSISLLKVADEILTKVSLPEAKAVRSAINQDLKQLLSVNPVDQNAIMQSLSQLANTVDELVVLNVNFSDDVKNEDKISDDVSDWKANLEKSAASFINHFIRITPRSERASQALLAPNQDIYLRENIRLRLQIAILAVPRQQNELYKQSLEAVAAWVRSYFDTDSETAINFLKALDELSEQSIYIEVPTKLNSLNALDKLLNKSPEQLQKIEISADKELNAANQAAAEEIQQVEESMIDQKNTEHTKPTENIEANQQ